jgi:hypothetical protein
VTLAGVRLLQELRRELPPSRIEEVVDQNVILPHDLPSSGACARSPSTTSGTPPRQDPLSQYPLSRWERGSRQPTVRPAWIMLDFLEHVRY